MRRATAALWLASAALASCSEEPPPRPRLTAATVPKSDADLVQEQLKKDPNDAEAWFHLAEILERASLHEREAEALKKAIELRPDMGWAHLKLGTTCNRLGRYEEAVTHFRAAEKLLKRKPTLYNNLAWSYGKLGRNAEEIAALRKAIEIRPTYATAHFNLGVALLRKGARREAEQEHRILLDLDEGAAAALLKEIERPAVAAGEGGRR
ncbi:MAG TPA: tetratricopeptide repeat protein [Anaeromyxobacter sp.]